MKERKDIGKRAEVGILRPATDKYKPEAVDVGRKVRFKLGLDEEDAQTVKVFLSWLVGIVIFGVTLGLAVRLFLLVSGLGG